MSDSLSTNPDPDPAVEPRTDPAGERGTPPSVQPYTDPVEEAGARFAREGHPGDGAGAGAGDDLAPDFLEPVQPS